MKVLLGITGGVAATLTKKLAAALLDAGHEVQIVATEKSFYFWRKEDLEKTIQDPSIIKIWTDKDEFSNERYVKDEPVVHIELRKWADIFLIAPATANTMAKMANGITDNLLTSVVRAWDRERPIIIAPAMNTEMWTHPATQDHIEVLGKIYRLKVVNPIAKKLACGDTGEGALAEIKTILEAVNDCF